MLRVNPFAKKRAELLAKREDDRKKARAQRIKDQRAKAGKKAKANRTKLDRERHGGLEKSYKDAEDLIAEEERQGNYQPGDTSEEGDE